MDTPFFIQHMGQWRFALFRTAQAADGLQGFADVHDGYDKVCRLTLATSFPSQNALGAALSETCLAWVKDRVNQPGSAPPSATRAP
jgi:hypothetical protein